MTFTNYRLPDGRIVLINEDVARGQRVIDFTLKGGAIVQAERVEPVPRAVDTRNPQATVILCRMEPK